MCAKMINDAIPDIKQQCMEECRQELARENASKSKQEKVDVRLNIKDIEQQIRNAFKRVFH